MKVAQIKIPKINSEDLKLYIYRSLNSDDINTISKVSNLEPIIIINQDTAITETIDDKEYYIVYDKPSSATGITYNGPQPNNVPVTEYEANINLVMLNSYTPVNELILEPLELNKKDGVVFYYSVIAINENNNQMTHLSKVSGVLIDYIEEKELNRQLWSCDNYTDSPEDEWTLVANIPYDETDSSIKIGNIERHYEIEKFGLPFVETVPKIEEVSSSLNSLVSNTFMLLEVQNPWQNNNKKFNYRKLKSYKVRNVYDSIYGEFSYPTYQSELPVSIEKMIIYYKCNPENTDEVISSLEEGVTKLEIIRRDGLFYDRTIHKSLGCNQWSIPLENNELSVFSESSIQDTINIQISAIPGNVYVFDIYLIDVYRNISENTHYILET